MSHPNEITIRVASPLLYIDDDSPEISGPSSHQNLTVIRRSASPNRGTSSSEISPMASMNLKSSSDKDQREQFELTIKGENTIINIQSLTKPKYDKRHLDNEELYELINQTVQEIFKAPGREEIQKAIENVGFKEERKFTKKGAWQMLSKSAKAYEKESLRDREERYPSIVLLQEPEDDEEEYQKSILVEDAKEKPKFEFRSKSLMALHNPMGSCPALNDLHIERHTIEVEKSYLEEEKRSLAKERAGLEKGKDRLEEEKRSLERSKSFFFQDKNILKEKKQVLSDEKKCTGNQSSSHILNKEKLCLELEKQLIADEQKLLTDEKSILNKEKDIIRKERNILGGEKSVLEDEKVILGKEKVVLEKQHSFVGDNFFKPDLGVREENCYHPHLPSVLPPPHCMNHNCEMNSYPTYVPVYSYPRPYMSSYRPCFNPTMRKSKTIQTQTDFVEAPAIESSEEMPGLPFGLLSGIFPRVVITSMGGLPHGAEERADNARNTGIREIPPDPPIKQEQSKKKPKTNKKLTTRPQPPKKVPAKTLTPPKPDLTLKAVSGPVKGKTSDKLEEAETEAEESGIQTLTSEIAMKDDTSGVSDETMSVETIHYGVADDFYSNYAIFPDKVSSSSKKKDMPVDKSKPLTSTGYDMYKKLTQLSLEQDEQKVQNNAKESLKQNTDNQLNLNINLNINGGNFAVKIPGRLEKRDGGDQDVSIHIGPLTGKFLTKDEDPITRDGKTFVDQSDLWHFSNSKSKHQPSPQRDVFVHLPQGPEVKFNLDGAEASSFNISQNEGSFSFNVGEKYHRCTSEASVGTDDIIAGGTYPGKRVRRLQLSPRTDYLLDALRQKLEDSEMEERIVSYGKSSKGNENPFSGLFLVKPIQTEKAKAAYIKKPMRAIKDDVRPREYLCEECLATMRLYEDEFQSVQNIVDKFEDMSKYGVAKF